MVFTSLGKYGMCGMNNVAADSATLMSGLKQKRRGDCWLEMCRAGVPTARLPSYP